MTETEIETVTETGFEDHTVCCIKHGCVFKKPESCPVIQKVFVKMSNCPFGIKNKTACIDKKPKQPKSKQASQEPKDQTKPGEIKFKRFNPGLRFDFTGKEIKEHLIKQHEVYKNNMSATANMYKIMADRIQEKEVYKLSIEEMKEIELV